MMFEKESAPRSRKAYKITTILHDYLGERLQETAVLDLGCRDGTITQVIGERVRQIVGIDIDETALQEAPIEIPMTLGDGAQLPFPDRQFDVVICAQVYEHTADQQGLASEVWRVLRPGGICFFSGPNKLALMEEHYWLPFLSWFPQRIADLYLKVTKRGDYYDVKPLLHRQLRQLWQGFTIMDYTPRLISEPKHFRVDDKLGRYSWMSKLPSLLLKKMGPIFPNFNWILVKNDER